MYTQEDMDRIKAIVKKRWLITACPSAVIVLAGIMLFVLGRIERSESMWIWTTILTIIGGGYFLFFYGVYVRPARIYRTHVNYMLNGRMRVTTGLFKSFAEEVSDREGVECHAMLLNVGEKDDPEDDRLFYYDALKPRPEMSIGTRVTVRSNDKMVSSMERV